MVLQNKYVVHLFHHNKPKFQKRDALLEEARSDYLDELSKVDDLEEYIQKLEEDIDSKVLYCIHLICKFSCTIAIIHRQ